MKATPRWTSPAEFRPKSGSQEAIALAEAADLGRRPRSGQQGRLVVVALCLGYLLHVAIRLLLARDRSGPLVIADEIGYLVNARVLTGGVPGDLSHAAFYRGGYSLWLAPAFWLTRDPIRAYHAVMVLNALLTSAVFPLLYLFLRRVLRLQPLPSLAASFAAAAYPPLVLNSLLAWSENLLAPLLVLWLLAVQATLTSRRLGAGILWAIGCGAAAGLLYVTHGRTVPLLALQTVLLALAALRRRQLLPLLVVATVVTLGAVLAGNALNQYLVRTNWNGSASSEIDRVFGVLRQPEGWVNVAGLTAGQWWYMAVGSMGLIAIGVAAAAWRAAGCFPAVQAWCRARLRLTAREGSVPALPVESAMVLGLLLASWLGIAVLVGSFLYPPSRPDYLIYGRYVDPLGPALLGVGLATLPDWSRSGGLPARLVALGVATVVPLGVVIAYSGRRLFGPISNNYNDLSLPFLSGSITAFHPRRVTLLALALCFLMVAVARFGRYALAAAALVVFLVSGVWSTSHLFASTHRAIYAGGWQALREAAGDDRQTRIGYDLSRQHAVGQFGYQYALPDARFVLLSDRDRVPSDLRLVITGPDWPEAVQSGGRIVWQDPNRAQTLWRLPGRLAVTRR